MHQGSICLGSELEHQQTEEATTSSVQLQTSSFRAQVSEKWAASWLHSPPMGKCMATGSHIQLHTSSFQLPACNLKSGGSVVTFSTAPPDTRLGKTEQVNHRFHTPCYPASRVGGYVYIYIYICPMGSALCRRPLMCRWSIPKRDVVPFVASLQWLME